MKAFKRLAVMIPALILIACLIGAFLTRGDGSRATLPGQRPASGKAGAADVVDQSTWRTAQGLAALAVSAEEQTYARETERLADHEVDQAFAQALRQAELESRVLTPEAQAVQQKVIDLKQVVAADTTNVTKLTAEGKDSPSDPLDEVDFAKAQQGLDQDELNDATQQLAQLTGDKRGKIQQELTAREASMKKYDETAAGGQVTSVTVKRYGTLWHRVAAWFDQRERHTQLLAAQQEATQQAAGMQVDLKKMQATLAETDRTTKSASSGQNPVAGDKSAGAPPAAAPNPLPFARDGAPLQNALPARASDASPAPAPGPGTVPGKATQQTVGNLDLVVPASGDRSHRMAMLRRMSAERSVIDILNDRIQGEQQLKTEYGRWAAQVEVQHTIVAHLILQSVGLIAFIVLMAVLLGQFGTYLLGRSKMERRRLHTLETILNLAIQLIGLLLILLVIFGPPSQVPTILGLATAGLTVVFQDFILAFFGWFVLMGRNGIHAGDWVEINGVGGEVVEISLFRTHLLETGNWTDMGHPTGRSVTFINSFAINGHYFNFSTSGQWMWDEISVSLPAAAQSFDVVQQIHTTVERETSNDVKLAEQEWRSSTKQNGLTQFSAEPGVDLRPGAAGIDVMVRYVTRAGDRFETRNRLYSALLALLHGKDGSGAAMLSIPAQAEVKPSS